MATQAITTHRPDVLWLTDLQKAKAEGTSGTKPKTTLQDLLERINATNLDADASNEYMSLIPTSPRSVEACFRKGIDPVELQFKPASFYRRPTDATEEITRLRFEKNEALRQERVRVLMDERKHLMDDGWTGDGGARSSKKMSSQDENMQSSAMVEKEKMRLEVLKRRQEKDLQQMVMHEVNRKELLDKQQKKVDEMERRALELTRIKQESDLAWITRQREIELQKLQEERELEREAKRQAEERFKRDKEMQRKEEEELKRIKREAFQNDLERRRRAEDSRAETDAILAMQAEEVRLKKLDMERRDVEREKRAIQEAKALSIANVAKRKKAELRIMSAQDQNAKLLQQKRSEFERRESIAEQRRKELDAIHRREEEAKRQEEMRKERERQAIYSAAVETEESRKAHIRARAEEKERQLADLYATREREHQLRRVEKEFELKMRLDNVDSIGKQQLYQRQQLLDRIMGDYDRTRTIMAERQSLQDQRRMANLTASLNRQAMVKAMDSLRHSKSIDKLAGPGGTVDLSSFLPRARPSTAN